jgi:hypothetical protein
MNAAPHKSDLPVDLIRWRHGPSRAANAVFRLGVPPETAVFLRRKRG